MYNNIENCSESCEQRAVLLIRAETKALRGRDVEAEIRGLRSSYPKNGKKNISGRSISTCRTLKVEKYSMSSRKWNKALMKYGKWGRDTVGGWWKLRSRPYTSDPKALLRSLDFIPGLVRSLWGSVWRMSGRQAMLFSWKFYFRFRFGGFINKRHHSLHTQIVLLFL